MLSRNSSILKDMAKEIREATANDRRANSLEAWVNQQFIDRGDNACKLATAGLNACEAVFAATRDHAATEIALDLWVCDYARRLRRGDDRPPPFLARAGSGHENADSVALAKLIARARKRAKQRARR